MPEHQKGCTIKWQSMEKEIREEFKKNNIDFTWRYNKFIILGRCQFDQEDNQIIVEPYTIGLCLKHLDECPI